jgi:hypothetical protein
MANKSRGKNPRGRRPVDTLIFLRVPGHKPQAGVHLQLLLDTGNAFVKLEMYLYTVLIVLILRLGSCGASERGDLLWLRNRGARKLINGCHSDGKCSIKILEDPPLCCPHPRTQDHRTVDRLVVLFLMVLNCAQDLEVMSSLGRSPFFSLRFN